MRAHRGAVGSIVWSGVILAAAALVSACGGSANAGAASAASATPTCSPTPSFTSVSGTVQSVSGNTITVSAANGTATRVTVAQNTRITKLVTATPAALTQGTRVQVMTDASTTSAQRILIVPQTARGSGGFPAAGASGTPAARFNRGCLRQGGQGEGGQGQGTQGRFAGLAGTVESASSSQLVVDDAQSQTFTLAITPATLIETSAAGQLSDVTTGAKVLVTGTRAAGGIAARSITLES